MFPRLIKFATIAFLGLNAAPAFADNGMAMTWKTYPDVPAPAVRVGCYNICDAYHGDTSTKERHPILCIVPGNAAMPATYGAYAVAQRPSNWKFYMGWSGGRIGLTEPIQGSTITDRQHADKLCKTALKDENARMAEHHDNKTGGWSLGALLHPSSATRGLLRKATRAKFWVAINNQAANPWD